MRAASWGLRAEGRNHSHHHNHNHNHSHNHKLNHSSCSAVRRLECAQRSRLQTAIATALMMLFFFFSTRHPFDTPHTPLRLQAHIDTRSCATPTMNSGSATSAHTHHETFHAKSTSLVTTRRSSAVIVGKSSSPRWSPCTTASG